MRNHQMPKESIVIPEQGHTLACTIRERMFENGAEFAACVVAHPQDTTLKVTIDAPDCKDCIKSSLQDAQNDIENALRAVAAYMAHQELIQTS